MTICRLTMFKIPNEEDVEAALQAYSKLESDNKKDEKPYILSCKASKLYPDPRSQGFTIVAETIFTSLEDMKYYDEKCEAHGALKKVVGPKVAGPTSGGVLVLYKDA